MSTVPAAGTCVRRPSVARTWRLPTTGEAAWSRGRDEGAAAVILLLLTPALLGLAGLVLDGGTALAARQRSADLAEQAARAGADHLDTNALRAGSAAGADYASDPRADALDATAARAAACSYVRAVEPDATCTVTVQRAATGTGQQIQVRIRTRTHTVLLGLIGINALHTDATATATAVTGIRTLSLGQLPGHPDAEIDEPLIGTVRVLLPAGDPEGTP